MINEQFLSECIWLELAWKYWVAFGAYRKSVRKWKIMKKTNAYDTVACTTTGTQTKKTLSSSNSACFWSFFQSATWKFCLWKLSLSFSGIVWGTIVVLSDSALKTFSEIKNCFCFCSHTKANSRQPSDSTLSVLPLQYKTFSAFHQSLSFDSACANSGLVSWPEQRRWSLYFFSFSFSFLSLLQVYMYIAAA